MSRYRRSLVTGGTYFFTVNLADRNGRLLIVEVDRLRHAFDVVRARHPFAMLAYCILPDHLHAVWRLPENDAAFGLRWGMIKRGFSTGFSVASGRSASKIAKREKGIWQRRFWEHQIRDETDFERHVDYVHYNPVKHGLVERVTDWPHSSFHAYVAKGLLPVDWAGFSSRNKLMEFGE